MRPGRPPPDRREYTLARFDVAPYLPDDPEAALRKLLLKADWLASAGRSGDFAEDGFGYQQHAWSKPSDEENLRIGIDCSRAIWFAFTHAGLPYNHQNDRYLPTAEMVGNSTPMAGLFDRCPLHHGYQLGDILVYRSATRGDGHVVMVIDPEKRIAWGSHGWDGSPRLSKLPIQVDTGVEYQKIKVKQDWARWDRRDMELKACWRYRTFVAEAKTGIGVPGIAALAKACDARQCRLGQIAARTDLN